MADIPLSSIRFPGLDDTYTIVPSNTLSFAPAYSASSVYITGDYVTRNHKLYRCIRTITAAESWTSSHWEEVNVGQELDHINTELGSVVNAFEPRWLLNKSISSEGAYGGNNFSAVTPLFYDAANTYIYAGSEKDADNITVFCYAHEYDSNFTWLNRHLLHNGDTLNPQSEDCAYYRFVFGRSQSTGVTITKEDLAYFSMIQIQNKAEMIPIQPNPSVVNSEGTINAMYSLMDGYLNYAYQGDKISGLIYMSENDPDSASAYSTNIAPIQVQDGVEQYSIQCSGFANLILRGVSFENSRYVTGQDGKNISQPWGYHIDDATSLTSGATRIIVSYRLLKYAEQHGYAYLINAEGNNVKAGDLVFTVTPTSDHYRGVTHVAVVLAAGADGRGIVAEARDISRTSGGTEYMVGLAVKEVTFKDSLTLFYGARFPLGDVNQNAKVLYRVNPGFEGEVEASQIIDATHIVNMYDQGLYTINVRGNFSKPPVVRIRYTGTSSYVTYGTMLQSGNIFTLPLYADASIQYIAINAPSDETITVTDYDLFEVVKGYSSANLINEEVPVYEEYDNIGYTLAAEQDLNDLDAGTYTAPTNAIAETLINSPTTKSFVLNCYLRGRTGVKCQVIYSLDNNIYMRNSSTLGWNSWYMFTGTEVI